MALNIVVFFIVVTSIAISSALRVEEDDDDPSNETVIVSLVFDNESVYEYESIVRNASTPTLGAHNINGFTTFREPANVQLHEVRQTGDASHQYTMLNNIVALVRNYTLDKRNSVSQALRFFLIPYNLLARVVIRSPDPEMMPIFVIFLSIAISCCIIIVCTQRSARKEILEDKYEGSDDGDGSESSDSDTAFAPVMSNFSAAAPDRTEDPANSKMSSMKAALSARGPYARNFPQNKAQALARKGTQSLDMASFKDPVKQTQAPTADYNQALEEFKARKAKALSQFKRARSITPPTPVGSKRTEKRALTADAPTSSTSTEMLKPETLETIRRTQTDTGKTRNVTFHHS